MHPVLPASINSLKIELAETEAKDACYGKWIKTIAIVEVVAFAAFIFLTPYFSPAVQIAAANCFTANVEIVTPIFLILLFLWLFCDVKKQNIKHRLDIEFLTNIRKMSTREVDLKIQMLAPLEAISRREQEVNMVLSRTSKIYKLLLETQTIQNHQQIEIASAPSLSKNEVEQARARTEQFIRGIGILLGRMRELDYDERRSAEQNFLNQVQKLELLQDYQSRYEDLIASEFSRLENEEAGAAALFNEAKEAAKSRGISIDHLLHWLPEEPTQTSAQSAPAVPS